jgi:hypothetical protein
VKPEPSGSEATKWRVNDAPTLNGYCEQEQKRISLSGQYGGRTHGLGVISTTL